jgi:hypothetical protein
VIRQADAAFHLAVQRQILRTAELAFDAHGVPEIHDDIFGRLRRRAGQRIALRTGGLNGLIAFPHMNLFGEIP